MPGPSNAETPERRDDGFFHRRLDVGEVRLHVAEARPAGLAPDADVPPDVPLVVFLHGFPEFWWSWRYQLPEMARAGFWAVAPDMRGYNESDKPTGLAAYAVEKLAGDVAGLVRALGRKKAIVVGHDWGAMVAWAFAQSHGPMLERLAILNVPHPKVMIKGLFSRPKQMRKSWYIFFFQLPRVPELALAANDYRRLRDMFRQDGVKADAIERYVEAMRQPGAATATINYYRASFRRVVEGRPPPMERIDHPVLVLWGDQDKVFVPDMAEPPAALVPNARVVHLADANHWLQTLQPERVNALLLDFLRERT